MDSVGWWKKAGEKVILVRGGCFRPGRGIASLTCLSGRLWLTDGSGGPDIILEAGEGIDLGSGRGDWLCQATGGAGAALLSGNMHAAMAPESRRPPVPA